MADVLKEGRERAARIALERERDVQGSYATDQGALGTPGYGHMEKYKPGDQIFPTRHPMVDRSNVRMSSISETEDEGDQSVTRHHVVPTMAYGTQLVDNEPRELARRMGLKNYPTFSSLEDAEDFIMAHHGNIDESGRLIK